MAEPFIAVPDDFPSVFKGTPAEERCARLGEIRVYVERGANEETELIRRLDRARVAINIRAHACFTDAVFAACPELKMISIWGTGTDNIDLESAKRRGITVCNTAGVNANAASAAPCWHRERHGDVWVGSARALLPVNWSRNDC